MNEQLESQLRRATRVVDQIELGSDPSVVERVQERLGRRERRRRRALVTSTAVIVAVALVGIAAVSLRPTDGPDRAAGAATSSIVADRAPSAPSASTSSSSAESPPVVTPSAEASLWRPIAPNPDGIGWELSAVWTGSEAFVLGRHGFAYDPGNDAWRSLAPFPQDWTDVDTCTTTPATCFGTGVGENPDGYTFVNSIVVWTGDKVLVIGGDLPAEDPGEPSGCVGTGCYPGLVKSASFGYVPSEDEWQALAPPPWFVNERSPHVWTGGELLVWPWDIDASADPAYAYDPQQNTWRQLPDAPIAPRQNAASVWTGREWIIWGGGDDDGEYADGAAYDPVTNTWRVLAEAPLSARKTTGVWTGTEMIVMAGSQGGGTNVCCGNSALTDGAAYEPASDTWRTLDGTVGHPGFEPLWTGDLLLMFAKGGVIVYDPTTQQYVDVCCEGLAGSTHIWTGDEAVSFGSYTTDRGGGIFSPP